MLGIAIAGVIVSADDDARGISRAEEGADVFEFAIGYLIDLFFGASAAGAKLVDQESATFC